MSTNLQRFLQIITSCLLRVKFILSNHIIIATRNAMCSLGIWRYVHYYLTKLIGWECTRKPRHNYFSTSTTKSIVRLKIPIFEAHRAVCLLNENLQIMQMTHLYFVILTWRSLSECISWCIGIRSPGFSAFQTIRKGLSGNYWLLSSAIAMQEFYNY